MAQRDDLDAILEQEFNRLDQRTEEFAPTDKQKISYFTVACLVLNRTIGSGIFVTPRSVLLATGSVGISLILWALGAVVSVCGLTVWNEFGLTVPLRAVPSGQEKSVPRSGGEKNYLEYLLQKPKFMATCMFGMAFLILGNLAGNAVSFGTYVLAAAGHENPPRGWNIAVAIAGLTVACLIHVFSRRGGILLSNIFAVLKVMVLLSIIVIGFAAAGGARLGPGTSHLSNLSAKNSFSNPQKDVSSYTFSFFYVLYSYSGFEQPFYVLSEVKQPKKVFPKATYTAMAIATVLFLLVNAAYISAIPLDSLDNATDMATLFFGTIFGPSIAPRVMSGIIAVCIYGNVIVMTFTASRVKQEIAKEGILPWSIFFAAGTTTPDAWLRSKFRPRHTLISTSAPGAANDAADSVALEQTPMAALLLHWIMSVLLIAVTSFLSAATAYFALVFLYSYVLIALIGFCVSTGLVYLHFSPSANWHGPHRDEGFKPWGGPTAAIIYSVVSCFVLVTAFLPPTTGSPFAYQTTHIQWYILPAIGLSSLLWGPIWWAGLHLYMRIRGLQLVVTRVPHIEQEGAGGDWVQRSEVVVRAWMSRAYIGAMEKSSSREDSGTGIRGPDMSGV